MWPGGARRFNSINKILAKSSLLEADPRNSQSVARIIGRKHTWVRAVEKCVFALARVAHFFLLAPFLPSPCIGTGGGCVDTRAKRCLIAKDAIEKVGGGELFVRASGKRVSWIVCVPARLKGMGSGAGRAKKQKYARVCVCACVCVVRGKLVNLRAWVVRGDFVFLRACACVWCGKNLWFFACARPPEPPAQAVNKNFFVQVPFPPLYFPPHLFHIPEKKK